ncbi:hypothetical protein ACFQ2B_25350 [Streptomyces stramineus]
MSRRVSLPGADELFRTTGGPGSSRPPPRQANGEAAPRVPGPAAGSDAENGGTGQAEHGGRGTAGTEREPAAERRAPGPERATAGQPVAPAQGRRRGRGGGNRRPSGRERHDEKITVYVSAEELMDLEHARLVLRGEHGLAVDRGRIVREAVAVVLADLESRGDASILVRRLRGR